MQISLKYLFGEPECKNGPAAKMFCGLDISKPELDQNGTKAERYQNSIVSERIYIRKGK